MIEAYGDGGFTIAGVRAKGSALVFPGRVEVWPVTCFEDITFDSLSGVLNEDPAIELLLIGCGVAQVSPQPALKVAMRDAGVIADFMNTGAACRTYNVLLAENRRVAAALIAVD